MAAVGDDAASVDSAGEAHASMARLEQDEDALGPLRPSPSPSSLVGGARRGSRPAPTSPAETDADADADAAVDPGIVSPLGISVREWAAAGYTPEALAFLADELVAVRGEQQELRDAVHDLAARVDDGFAALAARLGGRATSPPRLSVAGGGSPRPATPPETPASPASLIRARADEAAAAARSHAFAAPLGISTSSADDAPRVPVHIWAGTWNVGAAEPVGGPKGCKPADLERFAAKGYDLYVLAVQEGMSDRVFEEFAAATGTVRLSLTAAQKRDGPADGEAGAAGVALEAKVGDADKVLGRGDGSLVSLKFTGIAVFAPRRSLPDVRVMRADRLSFGATEGSKGAVAAVVRVHRSTVAFVSCHLASHKVPARLVQYKDVCKSLGAKLGNAFFQLNEQFHHVVFMGDFNYRCEGVSGDDAVALIRRGAAHGVLLPRHDSMRRHRAETGAWGDYDEPPMHPELWPTYKKFEAREPTDTSKPGWAEGVYRIKFREPVYKGGRVMDRVPGWCDRVLSRSHPHLRPFLFPLTQHEADAVAAGSHGDAGAARGPAPTPGMRAAAGRLGIPAWCFRGAAGPVDHGDDGSGVAAKEESSYTSINDALTVSDHSPVRCVFRLLAFRGGADDDAVPVALRRAPAAAASSSSASATVNAVLRVARIEYVRNGGRVLVPQVAKLLCPAPFELDDDAPEEIRVAKTREGLAATVTLTAASPAALPRLHALLKVQVDRSTKGHCVVPLRPLFAALDAEGAADHEFFVPLACDGISRADPTGATAHVQFRASLQLRKV